jgi:predicted flap endonuclease-1-like 5' DNA nuclease
MTSKKEDVIFNEDLLTKLVGAGNVTAAILADWEVVLIAHIACLDDTDVQTLDEV